MKAHKPQSKSPRRERNRPNYAAETVSEWEQRILSKGVPCIAVILARMYGEFALQLADLM